MKKIVVFDNTEPPGEILTDPTIKGGGYIYFDKDTSTAICIFKDLNLANRQVCSLHVNLYKC